MRASRVHAVIAAGVDDPSLVARWEGDPERLRRQGIDPASIDLDALRKFAGMTTKVRHNGLREALPLTFRFLNVAGLEIDVFAAYATFRATRGLAPTTEERTRDLLSFLEGWLDRDQREHSMLWDLVRHEHAISQLNALHQAPGTRHPALRIHGAIILHEMKSDPREVIAALHESHPPLDRVAFDTHYFGYWRPEDVDEIRILELDAFGFCALSLIDGVRSVADLSAAMERKRRPSRAFLQLLRQLAATGIIEFERA